MKLVFSFTFIFTVLLCACAQIHEYTNQCSYTQLFITVKGLTNWKKKKIIIFPLTDKQTEVNNVHWGRNQRRKCSFLLWKESIHTLNKHISSKPFNIMSRQSVARKSFVFPFKMQVLLNTVGKKTPGKRRKNKTLKCLCSFVQNNRVCHFLSFKSQLCQKTPSS